MLKSFLYLLTIIILYNVFIQKLCECIFKNIVVVPSQEFIQVYVLLLFIIGLLSTPYFYFKKKKNKIEQRQHIYNGLYYGNIILVLFILSTHWHAVGNDVKLFVYSAFFTFFMYFFY